MLWRGVSMTAAALVNVCVIVVPTRADVISVNFVGGQSGSTAPDLTKGGANVTGTAGAVPVANWNNEGPSQQTTPVTIVNSVGAVAASLAYTAPDNWAASPTSPGGGADAAVMSGYLDNLQNSGSITVTGLSVAFASAGYEVLVYQNTDSNGSFGYTVTDNAGHTVTAYGLQSGGANGNYPLAGGTNGFVSSTSTNPAGPATAANYVILKGLTGTAFTLTAASGTTGDGRVRPNGFQIVSTNGGDPLPGPGFTVTTAADHDDGVCSASDCTLREAVNAANGSSASTIKFANGLSLIVLATPPGPLPAITTNMTIDGGGTITISGANSSFIFSLRSGATLTLNNLTVTNGYNANGDGGAIRNGSAQGNGGTLNITNCKFLQDKTAPAFSGGAIVSYGPLNITNSEFGSNQAGNGGALFPRFSPAVTTITGCNFHDNATLNTTNGWGGAMLVWDGAKVSVTDSQFTNNKANSGDFSSSTIDRGGAIYVFANSSLTDTNSVLSGNSAFFGGAIYVDANGSATLTGSELHDNSIGIFDGTQGGGAIYNRGTLIVDSVQIHDNQADGAGGAIDNIAGALTVQHSSVLRHNHAGGGGAIENYNGTATVIGSTLRDNIADNYGGAIDAGIDASSTVTVTDSTLSGNSAGLHGGAIESENKLIVTNVTFSGNSGPEIIDQYAASLTLTNVTLAQSTGTGLVLHDNPTLAMRNTLLAYNSGGNCAAVVTSDGFNLADDTTCGLNNTGDLQGAAFNPKLGPLQNNGGPTATQLPGPGSPAIDNGTGNGAPATDQRGVMRPQGAAVDIGAVEVQPSDNATPTPTPTPTATPTPPSQLLNLSTRKQVGTGDNVLIGGFIVAGTEDKKVLLRGLGPSLPVAGALADPSLELHRSDTSLVAFDDNWRDKQADEINATGIPPSSDLESAIVATLSAKPASEGGAGYTGVLAGSGGTTGIGLLEIYDLNTSANSKLANISTRGFVGTGDDLLIGGFIPGPSDHAPIKVLVRALGPSLLAQGVSGALQDPVLELHDPNGTLVVNDDWKNASNAAEIQATLPPPDDRESAIITTLAPSNAGYTAVVRGANNSTGVALVEVYALTE